MEYRDFSAKSLQEAITEASVELGVTSDHLDYSIVEKGSGGILGFGRKDVTIKAKIKDDPVEVETEIVEEIEEKEEIVVESEEIEEKQIIETEETKSELKEVSEEEIKSVTKSFLDDLFKAMDMEVEEEMIYSKEDNSLSIELMGPSMGILIGKRGQTLDALQYIIGLAINKHFDSYVRVKLDTEDYRKRRRETLENLAKNIAFKVKRTKKTVNLEAMNPYERRTIHFALQNDDEVVTYSEGDEPYRHVVVALKK